MKNSKFWLAVLVGGLVVNIFDWLVQGILFKKMFYSAMPDLFVQEPNIAALVIGDFVAVLVFAWIYDKVAASFSSGVMAGLYMGILVNFPTWIFAHLTVRGYSYGLAWSNTIYGIVWYMIVGAVLAAMMKKVQATA